MIKNSDRLGISRLISRTATGLFIASLFTTAVAGDPSRTAKGLVLRGANIVGHGPADITIREGRIESISHDRAGDDTAGIDLRGRYIVPGFIDSHVHLAIGYRAAQLLHGGIVAAVDLAAPLHYLGADYGELLIRLAGPMVTARRGYPTMSWGKDGYGLETGGVESVQRAVEFLAASGAAVIKMPVGDTTGNGAIKGMTENTSTLSDAELKAIVERAHALGLRVVAHAITDDAALRAAQAGADVLAHTPTVALSGETIAAWSTRALISSLAAFKHVPVTVDNLRLLRKAGTTILYGTDLGYTKIPAINVEELELLGKAGLDGEAILRSVTETPAKFWGFEGLAGVVPGNRATLLVLDADPRDDLLTLARPVAVYINGIVLDNENSTAANQRMK